MAQGQLFGEARSIDELLTLLQTQQGGRAAFANLLPAVGTGYACGPSRPERQHPRVRSAALAAAIAAAAAAHCLALGAVWLSLKRLPPGLHIVGAWQTCRRSAARFLRDLSAADANGAPLIEQQIDAELLGMVARARQFVLLDTGLFGDLPAAGPGASRLRTALPIAAGMVDALTARQGAASGPGDPVADRPIDAADGRRTASARAARHRRRRGHRRSMSPGCGTGSRCSRSFWNLCCRWWSRALTVRRSGRIRWRSDRPRCRCSSGVSCAPISAVTDSCCIADDGVGGIEALLFSHPLHAEAGIQSATALSCRAARSSR